MAEFKVGGKVVCVKYYPDLEFGKYHIHKNEVRTVRKMRKGKSTGVLVLHFQEAVLPQDNGEEWGYEAEYFIPLDDFKEVTFKEIKEPISAQ